MGQERGRQASARQSDAALVHRPFSALNRLAGTPRVTVAPRGRASSPALQPAPTPPANEATLFLDAVVGVKPLDARERERVAQPAPAFPNREVTHPDAEALAELCDLVTGTAPFDITDSDEYVEGAMVGLDPRLLRRLRAGEFAYQAHLDLHGMTSDEARAEVDAFLTRVHQNGKRCVLIIHGRGRNSKDQVPVLKSKLTTWLARGQSARRILAFTSARACDGGVGAVYVLLRRQRHIKRPIRVTEGAKR
jgi:DNA-nicking Smr family endonuclease